jgi:hypothetical protein
MIYLVFSIVVLLLVSLCNHVNAGAALLNGGPGTLWKYDAFNGGDWNRTYGPTEPQQIHLSISSEAENAKIQFATQDPIDTPILKYWPKSAFHKSVQVKGGEV